MRCLLQRVTQAEVRVAGEIVGSCGVGWLILAGVAPTDDDAVVTWMARKIADLRLFPDDEGKFNRSIIDVGGSALVVSQFTLYADATKGTRPSFISAAPPEIAEPRYEQLCDALSARGIEVGRGVFAASMQVSLVNDGPVTMLLEREAR